MRATLVLAIALAILTAVRASSAQATAAATRFPDPGHITGDPTGLQLDLSAPAAPRYPQDAYWRLRTGAPVVAYVVDTLGRVELRSASFINDPPDEFRQAVCDFLPKVRFHPVVVEGQKWRVLVVQFYGFNNYGNADAEGLQQGKALADSTQVRFATQPVRAVVPELESRPHCEPR